MFENLLSELENFDGKLISIDIPVDDNGYIDRRCPDLECKSIFKVNYEDWGSIVKDEIVYCPICKHTEIADEWNTEEQEQYIETIGMQYIQEKMGQAIRKDVNKFNRKQKPGLISMSLSYKPKGFHISIPPIVAKELEQNYICSNCNCRYSYLGTAYFCPACGNENVEGNIAEWIKNIENFIKKYNEIERALKESLSEQDVKSYLLQILEDHYCKLVSIFQKFAERQFKKHSGAKNLKIRKNVFQNLVESSLLWEKLTGKSYELIFDINKYIKIKEHFQIRHLLMHTSGIIDENFIQKTSNRMYVPGKRVLIDLKSLQDFLLLVKELMSIMECEYKE